MNTLATALEKLEEGNSPSQNSSKSGAKSRSRGGIASFKPILKE